VKKTYKMLSQDKDLPSEINLPGKDRPARKKERMIGRESATPHTA
jgi:hypothetical protein